jgi:glycosyltransferase involved in cell wall biosynthesis
MRENMDSISIAIPTHDERWQWTGQTVAALQDDPRVAEIVINDDGSPLFIREQLAQRCAAYPKVKFSFNHKQEGVFKNKFMTVNKCLSPVVALIDSDNIVGKDYIDALEKCLKNFGGEDVIYCPMKAEPRFDFSKWRDHVILRSTLKTYLDDRLFKVFLNTGNYAFTREKWLSILRPLFNNDTPVPSCCDVIWMCYHLMTAGMLLHVVDGMRYLHTDHPRSTYRLFIDKEPNQTEYWQERMRTL